MSRRGPASRVSVSAALLALLLLYLPEFVLLYQQLRQYLASTFVLANLLMTDNTHDRQY